jgi:glycosyltransferase involved in cell wall biosynthesis
MTPPVSVLVPTTGRIEFLADTMRSVQEQTFADFEVLVLDNASPAPARDALANWATSDTRIRIMRSDTRLPMFENFNRGIQAARGRCIAFFHDDDVYLPRFLQATLSALDDNPFAAFCGSNYDFIDEHGKLSEQRRWIRGSKSVAGRRFIEMLVRRGRNPVVMPGIMFRREAILAGFDENLPIHFGDFVLLMRLAEEGEVALLEETLVRVRRHVSQASQAKPLSVGIPLRTRLLLDYLDEYLFRHPDEVAMVERLRRRLGVLHRVGLLWGWATAADTSEAFACTAALGASRVDRLLRGLLTKVDRLPVRAALGGATLKRVARSIGGTIGV